MQPLSYFETMFNFFKKKELIKGTDLVWINQDSKWEALAKLVMQEPVMAICWFEDTLDQASRALENGQVDQPPLIMAREIEKQHAEGKKLIFVEHHPLRRKEEELYEKLGLKITETWSSLDEPLLLYFGGQRIAELMQTLGLNSNESINHPMISKAISRAQQKIGKKISAEFPARSQSGWLSSNLGHQP